MKFDPTRLGLLVLGERLVAAAVRGSRVETFQVEAENAAEALRAELDQRQVTARTVAIGLPRGSVTVKSIDLPAVTGEVDEMVRFELERHLPYPCEDATFDYLPLPADRPTDPSAAPGRRVVVAAADRRVVDSALRIAEEAKLRPVSITVAAHNLVSLVALPRQGRFVWVHRVGDQAELLFLAGRTLLLSRSVAAADNDGVAEEVRRSLTAARWRECDAIWVSGDAEPDDLADALAVLGAPIGHPPFSPRARRLMAAILEGPQGTGQLALAVAIGGRVRPLELIPAGLRPHHLTQPQLITIGAVAATVLLGLVALLAPGYRDTRRLNDVNRRIAQLDSEVRAVESVAKELERRGRVLTTIQGLESSNVKPLAVLRELTELVPNDAWLTMLSVDNKGVELTGQAGAAATLIPLLENSPLLERVEFSSPVTRGRDREQFRIRASWEVTPGAIAASPAPIRPAARPGGTPR